MARRNWRQRTLVDRLLGRNLPRVYLRRWSRPNDDATLYDGPVVGLFFDQPPYWGLPANGVHDVRRRGDLLVLDDGRIFQEEDVEAFGLGGWDWYCEWPEKPLYGTKQALDQIRATHMLVPAVFSFS